MSQTLEEILREPIHSNPFYSYPLLPVGGTMLVLAEEKSFKSFTAINMGYDLASGGKLLGVWPIIKPLSVLYIEQEIGKAELRKRLELVHIGREDVTASLNFHVVSKDLDINLDTTHGFEKLATEVAEAQPNVLILDPLVEFHSSEENSSTEMKKMLDPIKKLMRANGMSLILLHHNNKGDPLQPNNRPSRARGSSYLTGWANTIINIWKPVRTQNDYIQLDFTLRSDKPPFPMKLQFNEGTGGFDRRN